LVGSPLALLLMSHFHSPTDTGVSRSFLVMGGVYLLAMASGALLIRIPHEGWHPEKSTKTITVRDLVSDQIVTVTQAVRTRQFWLLWLVICLNSIAGFGILEQASPMIQDLFGIGAVAAGGFVGVLSLFNMAGRFFWSSVSDYLGRKTTFVLFFAFGLLLYWFLPYSAGNRINSIALFVLISGVLISIYSGGFSTIPAYVKDMFGTIHVGAIYGRMQTATSTAGILGPILVNYSRQHQLAMGASRAGAYQHVLHLVTGFLVFGLMANLLVRPVASKFWIAKDPDATSEAIHIQTPVRLEMK
jgi:MFS family permease